MKKENDPNTSRSRSSSATTPRSSSTSGGENGAQKPKGTASPVQFPTLSLPKDGGAIQVIGEKFQANPVTGTSSMSIPIAVSPGRSGFAPQLALSYDSGAGNGAFGLGWDVGLPKYHDGADMDSDVFLISDAEDLVPVLKPDGSRKIVENVLGFKIYPYRPRIEGLFAKIENWGDNSSSDAHSRSNTKDDLTSIYAPNADSRIANPDNSNRAFSELLERTLDHKGNVLCYEYKKEDGAGVARTIIEKKCQVYTQQNLKWVRYENTKPQVLQSEVVHYDETGFYVDKERDWEHVASNERSAYMFVHRQRGKEAHEKYLSILPDFFNCAVHDYWATYIHFLTCKYAVCGAQLLCDLNALIKNGSKRAVQFHSFLLVLYRQTDHGKSKLPPQKHTKTFIQYKKLLHWADQEEPLPIHRPRGKQKQTKGRNLFDRLSKHQHAVLAFAFHTEVPFTNNQAKRDIRPTKTKMKVSGCFRIQFGAEIYAHIQSFVSTVRKFQFNPLNELYTVLSGGIPEYRAITC